MSEQKPRVAIVGLGTIGASMGLALRQAAVTSVVIGHDKEPAVANQARKAGAVDRTDWNLISACEGADLVVLALPLGAIRQTLEVLAPHLRGGCVVVDTAPVKRPVLRWADELLPAEVHYVGLHPIVGVRVAESPGSQAASGVGPPEAGADLFRDRLICVVPSARASTEAVKLATDLVTVLGGKAVFYDALEHDGLAAGVDQLPSLLALALLETMMGAPAWRDLRKLAGTAYEMGTSPVEIDLGGVGEACWANRDNVVRWISCLCDTLDSIRGALTADAEEEGEEMPSEVDRRLAEARRERGRWLQVRATGDWEQDTRPEMPPKQSMLQPLLGGLLTRRPRREVATDSGRPRTDKGAGGRGRGG